MEDVSSLLQCNISGGSKSYCHESMIISLGIYICCNEVQMLHLHITQQESLCDNAFKYLYFAKRIWNETIINSEYLAK